MSELTNAEVIRAWAAASDSAVAFGEEGDFAHQHLLNPAIFALLGEVTDKQILDAGCGQGYLCRLLARKGASVTGVEPADGLYGAALQREEAEPLGITYLQHDLSTFTALQSAFDVVIANMVFMDIPDYTSAIRNCIAALKPGGDFIFSLLHPCFEEPGSEWLRKGCVEVREYLREHVKEQRFGYLFHRPLCSYLNLVVQEGCALRQIIEPQLSQELARHIGNERDVHVPSFIVIHAARQQ
ncbi:MAG TPA: class I SAM-dependent methyltransferase [Ktedonobacterales bacterium]|jgi:2-polyprenyl-3-methyl-5-hydroxy-6-metoxy-1,4-benzoquinol methylase